MGLIADIARYHLLVSLQRWAGPALAILCAHEHIRAGALSLPPPQVPDPEPLTEEQETTRRIRLAALKVIVQASASNLHGLIDDVDKRRLTVPAAERRLLATLPPAEEFARDVIARLEASLARDVESVQAAQESKCESKDPPHCRVHGTPLKKTKKAPQAHTHHPSVGKKGTWQELKLESAADFPAKKGRILTARGINRAYKMIKKGFILHSAAIANDEVRITKTILKHWRDKHKTRAERTRRMEVFMEAMRTFKYPQEVWVQEDGKRAYYRSFTIGNRQEFISGVIVSKNNMAISFIRSCKPNYINNKRKGKLMYKA